ncbi:PA2169 family four-helix-bundle protein [Mucilaginibacter sp. cycad4]|uniref:PA2169 family four-helix-bundle protein n=1 Tax=Mucilaginibacter sp. cycad4 TaxID=3342096 RepID=UPI002AAB55D1|nr:PA2169 family four-helix-bundle protein [Mucilaginibacter gossypii]WPV02528.1 PA2169 family four-helix-bundle protein [Mucilaginibacter gossypii]
MENTQATVQILNDLIQINNDRIEGYQRASKDLKDGDTELKSLFTRLIGQSQGYRLALGTEVSAFGKDIETGTTTSGKIHRAWLDVKAAFTGHDTHNVLEECEFGEDAILKAYRTALEDENLPAYLRETISQQESELLDAHDEIKALRDIVH